MKPLSREDLVSLRHAITQFEHTERYIEHLTEYAKHTPTIHLNQHDTEVYEKVNEHRIYIVRLMASYLGYDLVKREKSK